MKNAQAPPGAAQSLARGIHSYRTAESPFRVFSCRPVSAKERKATPVLQHAVVDMLVDATFLHRHFPAGIQLNKRKPVIVTYFIFYFLFLSLFYNFDYYCISFIVSCNAIVANVIYYMLLLYIVSIVDAVLHMYTNNSLN